LAALGVAGAFLGAIIFGSIQLSLNDRNPVLAVARPVAAGQIIGDADLVVVRISSEGALQPIAASDRPKVVGRVAALPLAPGSLLSSSQVGSNSVALQQGQAVVGMALKANQLPTALRAGDRVVVIDTGAKQAGQDLRPVTLGDSALVYAVGTRPDTTGATFVSLNVDAASASTIATAAAANRVSLILLPPPPAP
jgi:hypothetical protein